MTERENGGGRKVVREFFGLFLIFWGLLVLLSLISYNQGDPAINHAVSQTVPIKNSVGLFGAYLSGLLVDIFGVTSLIWPAIFIALGGGCISSWLTMPWWRWCGLLLMCLCLISLGAAWNFGIGDVRGGGMLGRSLYQQCTAWFNPLGSIMIWLFLLFLALEMAFGIGWLPLIQKGWKSIQPKVDKVLPNIPEKFFAEKLALFRSALPTWHRKKRTTLAPQVKTEPSEDISNTQHISNPHLFQDEPTANSQSNQEPEIIPLYDVQVDEPTPQTQQQETTQETNEHIRSEQIPNQERANDREKPLKPEPFIPLVMPTKTETKPESKPQPLPKVQTILTPAEIKELLSDEPINEESLEKSTPSFVPLSMQPPMQEEQKEKEEILPREKMLPEETPHPADSVAPEQTQLPDAIPETAPLSAPVETQLPKVDTEPVSPPVGVSPVQEKQAWIMPSLDFLKLPQQSDALPNTELLEKQSQELMNCLADFNVQGELIRVTPGPVVTLFEIRPAPGVRVGRITNLNDDIARTLRAEAVRIQAPVPGFDTVGIEIPNKIRSTVNFRELIQSEAFQNSTSCLSMALGKDIEGRPTVQDLSTMPHVLVAGTTGSGKSVCLNSILVSFLYKSTPDEVRLMLIDPKRVEMSIYRDMPHLIHPVVTEMTLAKTALDWAVHEMEHRYDCLARLGVKNIKEFNKKIAQLGTNLPASLGDLHALPYLVIVIDELADLMMTAGKEVEACLVRLAQLARAAGIHLIVATQRPSVDVVTGILRANFPCRIAFQVANKYDSRTILDSSGAEKLLGKGDMLFKSSGGKLQRLHGPFVSDEEVEAVVAHWKKQHHPDYEVDFSEWTTQQSAEHKSTAGSSFASGNADEEALYAETVAFVREQGRMSISLLQRRFRIGFNKAARFVERMEQEGILPPASRANRARQVRLE